MKEMILPDNHDQCIRLFLDEVIKLQAGKPLKGGVIHVGAHIGEEVPAYRDSGFNKIYLIEPNPEVIPRLVDQYGRCDDITIVQAALGESSGVKNLIVHRTSKGGVESSGLLELDRLGEIVPVFSSDVIYPVQTISLDDFVHTNLLESLIDLIVLDVQGAELSVLKGGLNSLRKVKNVVCEVNLINNYKGCALEPEIDEFMAANGFKKKIAIYHELYEGDNHFPAWGECLWHSES